MSLNTGIGHNKVNVCPTTQATMLLEGDVTVIGGGPTDVVINDQTYYSFGPAVPATYTVSSHLRLFGSQLRQGLVVQNTNAVANGQLDFQGQLEGPNATPILSETLVDGFHTRNQVYAGQLGMRYDGRFGAASLRVTAKVGFGPNHQTVTAAGTTTANFADGTTATAPGGLLALPGTNIGQVNNNPFVIVPQVDVRLGYRMTNWLQLFIGYDFLFINEVVRPGSQITLNVNSALIPASPNFGAAVGPNEPSHLTKRDEFWAQGLTFGIEFRY